MRRSYSWQSTALALTVLTLVLFACKHPAAPPPPPPPVAVATPAAAPCAAPVITLRADNATVARGANVSLTWNARNTTSVDIQPGIGAVAATGTRAVTPASSVTYTATATGPCGTAADTLRVTVNAPAVASAAPAPTRGGVVAPPAPNLTIEQLVERNMLPINFDYDKSDIRDDQKTKIQSESAFLKANSNIRLTIEGHADERGSEEYNLALGDRRAASVKAALAALGIPENRLSSVSYGEERPVCRFQTEECYAQNRRAAFKVNP